jgi:predicted nucleotidyltransferase
MNAIRQDFPDEVKQFFYKLQEYLDTEIYFYGSVNRPDYVHGKSDIDIAIFTDNEKSIMTKIQHFIHVSEKSFDKLIWKFYGKMIYGYKIKCEDHINLKCEIAIYNNEYKTQLLDDMVKYNSIPIHIAFLLFILKTLHYTFPIISLKTYSDYKRFLFNTLYINKQDNVFFLLKQT